ncbi:MAG: formimidoylglutamase [Asgard group archaeon]|nr:formimidoylglutamase [Asgard group archaeon]
MILFYLINELIYLKQRTKENYRAENFLSLSTCLRQWEDHQKKGFDPNETRMSDILECWTGEPGPAIGTIGIPFDSAVLGRKGAKGGPKKIRDAIRYFKAYDWEEDFWFGNQQIYDFGDIILGSDSVLESHKIISEVIEKLASKEFTLVILGGDHSIAYPNVRGISKANKNKKIGLINIDAHLDVREVIDGRISSGTSFRRLLDDKIIKGKNFVEIGIRNFTNAKAYRQYVDDQGGTIITIDDIRKEGLNIVIQKTIDKITNGTDFTYISLDMDGLDQIYAPGVSAPTPNGLSPYQVQEIIKRIVKQTNIAGMDIVELNPLYDTADTTAINAANFLVQFVASHLNKKTKNCG